MKKILPFLLFVLLAFTANAQEADSLKKNFKINTLRLETRVDFDYYQDLDTNLHDLGFTGKYLNFVMFGNLTDRFSYAYRQRILPFGKINNFFDNTDYINLTAHFKHGIDLTFGKQVLYIGGFEYEKAPIDVYYGSIIWSDMVCYEFGLTASFTDKSKHNRWRLQFSNSPYSNPPEVVKPKRNLFAYSFSWDGMFKHFQSLYSVNLFQRDKNKYTFFIALGNQFTFNKWRFYVDYVNRTTNTEKFLDDFSVIGRVDIDFTPYISMFIKGGYDQNKAENAVIGQPELYKDIFVKPGVQYAFAGLGLVFVPKTYPDIRTHTFFTVDNSTEKTNFRFNVGLTWRIDFAKYIKQ